MLDRKVIKLVESPYEEIAYSTGYVLRGLTFKWKVDTVLMVVKLRGRLDGDVVGFVECKDYITCMAYLADWTYSRNVPLKLRPDKWV